MLQLLREGDLFIWLLVNLRHGAGDDARTRRVIAMVPVIPRLIDELQRFTGRRATPSNGPASIQFALGRLLGSASKM
jgi:hypothetical protein